MSDQTATVEAAQDRAVKAEQALHRATVDLVEAEWQVVVAVVRSLVPEATGIRTTGAMHNEFDAVRLMLVDVLADGEPVVDLPSDLFRQLEDELEQPLMAICDHEGTAAELWLSKDDDDTTDHDLPAAPATLAVLPAEARFYFPTVVIIGLKDGRVTHAEIGGVLDGLATEWVDNNDDSMQDPEECPPALGQLAGDAIDQALPEAEREALHGGVTVYTDEPHPLAKTITVYRHQ